MLLRTDVWAAVAVHRYPDPVTLSQLSLPLVVGQDNAALTRNKVGGGYIWYKKWLLFGIFEIELDKKF